MIRKLSGWCRDCLGCPKLEDEKFTGRINCDNYSPAMPKNVFLDEIIKKTEKQKHEIYTK